MKNCPENEQFEGLFGQSDYCCFEMTHLITSDSLVIADSPTVVQLPTDKFPFVRGSFICRLTACDQKHIVVDMDEISQSLDLRETIENQLG